MSGARKILDLCPPSMIVKAPLVHFITCSADPLECFRETTPSRQKAELEPISRGVVESAFVRTSTLFTLVAKILVYRQRRSYPRYS